jgi:hypothetical protein
MYIGEERMVRYAFRRLADDNLVAGHSGWTLGDEQQN